MRCRPRTGAAARARGAAHAARAERGAPISWAALAQHLEESRERARRGCRRCMAQGGAPGRSAAFIRRCRAVLQPRVGDPWTMPARRTTRVRACCSSSRRRRYERGDLDAGRRNSCEAFPIGESLDEAELLADAALTYGSIFTFGSVDPRLVGMLKAALARVGEATSIAARACRRAWPRRCSRPLIRPSPSRWHTMRSGSRVPPAMRGRF